MLDTRNPVVLHDVPDVIVYADDASTTVFYALPARPRLALDEQGKRQLSLVAYGTQAPSGFKARGGFLTLTTALQLTAEEQGRVHTALTRRLAREFQQPDNAPPLVPNLRPIEWVKGSVELRIVPGVSVSGTPSLFGANQFSVNIKLDARQIGVVLDAWQRGLPEASITYQLTARMGSRGATTTTHTMSYESYSVNDVTSRSTIDSSVRQSSGEAANADLAFTGPLLPADVDPRQFLNVQSV